MEIEPKLISVGPISKPHDIFYEINQKIESVEYRLRSLERDLSKLLQHMIKSSVVD